MKIGIYKILIIVLIICIFATLFFTYKTSKEVIKKEGFVELYFENQRDLPEKIVVNESINLSIVIHNNELSTINYLLEIDSLINNFTKNISLEPQTKSHINLSVISTTKNWEISIIEEKEYNFRINKIEDVQLINDNENYFIIDHISYYNQNTTSHNIDLFGEIYHTNLSFEELKEDPFRKYYEYNNNGVNEASSYKEEIILYVNNNEFYVNYSIKEETYQYWKEPFIVRLYNPEESQESVKNVYFWYEII